MLTNKWDEMKCLVPFCITVPQINCVMDHSSSCAGHSCWCKVSDDCCDFSYAEMTRTGVLLTITKEEVEDWHNVKQTTPVSVSHIEGRPCVISWITWWSLQRIHGKNMFGNNNTVCPAESNIAPPFKGPEKQETTENWTKWNFLDDWREQSCECIGCDNIVLL